MIKYRKDKKKKKHQHRPGASTKAVFARFFSKTELDEMACSEEHNWTVVPSDGRVELLYGK